MPTTTAALSARGNKVTQPGHELHWPLRDGSGEMTAVADHFALSASCEGGKAPKNGVYLTFDLRFTTPASLPADVGSVFHRDTFSVIGADGVTYRNLRTTETYSCDSLDDQWSLPPAPGSTYKGQVLLDIPAGSTTLIYSMPGGERGSGVEWPLPQTPATPATTVTIDAPRPAVVESPQERDLRIRNQLAAEGCSSNGCIQTWFGCRDGYITGDPCDFYRRHPIG
ncbi:hypothetical protein [Nocardia wallacei]|uniref:hypothetical protein n=1 Tax=Nocardia wallacei TaxID=480035 RepID=UPI002454A33F|nr:hypothetical protein [Nocardia wallacei]